jgi:hypothetical protein
MNLLLIWRQAINNRGCSGERVYTKQISFSRRLGKIPSYSHLRLLRENHRAFKGETSICLKTYEKVDLSSFARAYQSLCSIIQPARSKMRGRRVCQDC